MVGRVLGRYRVVSKLGQGGMATVWKAEDLLLQRPVALKVLADDLAESTEARRRFLKEARTAARLDHPGIASVLTADEAEGLSYIVLAYIDGVTLAERLSHGPLEWREGVHIVLAAAHALAYAHDQGVIHRDVSNRNIMVARDGQVLVLDFGIARAAGDTRFTSTSVTLGTVAFIAPEVAFGAEADVRSDVYGLGVVLYEALTGVLPFHGDRPETVLFAAAHRAPAPPRALQPTIPEPVERIVLRALEKSPDRRYASMNDLAADLEAALSEPSEPAIERGRSASPGDAHARGPGPEASSAAVEAPAPRTPSVKYLLVLPFEDSETDESCRLLANGLAEVVGSLLGGLPGLYVIPPPTVESLAEAGGDPRRLARQTGANLVLKGFLQRRGPHVRVTYSLLDPYRGIQIGAGVVDESAEALFLLEDRLASALRGLLGFTDEEARARGRRERDPAAREHYLQALGYLRRYENEASVDGAVAILERLTDTEDGRTGATFAALGRAYLFKYRLTQHRMWESKAAEACERATALDPQAPEASLTLGDIHMEAGRHDDAIADYRRAIALAPEMVEAHLGLSRAQEARGDVPGAIATCEGAISRWPDDWRCYSHLGTLRYACGRFDEAARSWGRLVEIAPDNSRGYLQLGSAYFQMDRFEEASRAFQRSIEILPTASALSNLGTVLFYLGRHAEAIAALERAAQLRPLDPLLWGHLGSACTWSPGFEPRAHAALDRAIELMRGRLERNPREAEDWALLGSWLANRGRGEEAKQAIDRALALAPENVRVMARVGVTCEHIGNRARAVELLRAAVRRGHHLSMVLREPTLRALRESPEFQEILEVARQAAGTNGHPNRVEGGAA